MILQLFAGHFLCDYPLQGDFLARGKNHKNPIPGVPWWQCLTAHAFIQGGMVYLVTGSYLCAYLEVLLHWVIDYGKSDGCYGYNVDQALHIACKVLWAVLMLYGVTW